MNEEQFHEIGKKIPYQVPDGFFDDITWKTMAEVKKRNRQGRKMIIFWSALSLVATLTLLITIRLPQLPKTGVAEKEPAETSLQAQVSSEDWDHPAANGSPEKGLDRSTERKPGEVKDDVPDDSRALAELLSTLTDEELLQLAARFTNDLLTESTNEY
jgi:hypothetical protein